MRHSLPEGKNPAKGKIKRLKGNSVKTEKIRKKLISECDLLVSQLCRLQWDNKCGMCGRNGDNLAAHHFFGKKSHGSVRHDSRNLILLCFGCHIRRVHQEGDTEPAREAIIKRIGAEEFEAVKWEAHQIRKFKVGDLEDIKLSLITARHDLVAQQAQELF